VQRSVKLNSYQVWHLVQSGDNENQLKLDEALRNLAKRGSICYGEGVEYVNDTSGWSKLSPQSIKTINPTAKVYRLWASVKPKGDTDWEKPKGTYNPDNMRMQLPLLWSDIEENDWWLRDGNGEKVEAEPNWAYYIDLGKPGVKEAFLKNALARMQGKEFDGVVFDGAMETLTGWLKGRPLPKNYASDEDWFKNAWQPFLQYIVQGFHTAGYRVIQNCGGEYLNSDSKKQWNRSLVDGTVYEQWAVNWPDQGSGWLPGAVIERRINAIASDPLEVWTADYGLKSTDPQYGQKQKVGLAMYYVGMPSGQYKRSYHHYGTGTAYWESIWDFNIGIPAEPAVKMPGKFYWTRKFTRGIVILNYESSETIAFGLDTTYVTPDGNATSGQVTVPPHSALILAKSLP
jgi:hypothetical protein